MMNKKPVIIHNSFECVRFILCTVIVFIVIHVQFTRSVNFMSNVVCVMIIFIIIIMILLKIFIPL